MKHGIAFRKLSRTSSHRNLMLRNLVTSLFEHEQIKTTLPKAREAARLAEKIITMGKQRTLPTFRQAFAFILKPQIIPKIFNEIAERYADRQGGYTRVHKFGNRQGDNAPRAILELVDNPRDLKFEMTARAVGWECLRASSRLQDVPLLKKNGIDVTEVVKRETALEADAPRMVLRPLTRWNMQKILKFREPAGVAEFVRKANSYADYMMANEPKIATTPHIDYKGTNISRRRREGWAVPWETPSAMKAAEGSLGRKWKLRRSQQPRPLPLVATST